MKVFYRPEQVARISSYSPSALKPRLVVEDWLKIPLLKIEICSFEPASPDQIALAHDTDFVRDILTGKLSNGFGNTDSDVARSLPYTTGSMVAAAEYAVLHREAVCSPTSGFHHACFSGAQGYCTFNGLMVTALVMKEAGLAHRVGIIDCDAHYGNGTDDIISRHGIDWVNHHTMGSHFHDRASADKGKFKRWLDKAIDDCMDCDLILYQAGADPHVNDPLGGVLTTRQMSERDRTVFKRLGQRALVWNLAGGYQTVPGATDAERIEPVLSLHRETARLHCEILS